MQVRPFHDDDEDAVIELWNRCGLLRPWNDPRKDIARKKLVQRDLFLVGAIDGRVVATVMAGYDGHRGWIYLLGVDPEFRHQGYGRRIVEEAVQRLRDMGCPKINLQVRGDNHDAVAYYKRTGFTEEDRISFGKRIERDD
jgi:ribosomal protein S18 acetylase RimI-like enzyme